MLRTRLLVLAMLLVAALSGCVGDDVEPTGDDPTDPRTLPSTPSEGLPFKPAKANTLEEQLRAIEVVPEGDAQWQRPNLTKADWLFLSTTMTPEGSVVVFEYEYPSDALVTDVDRGIQVVSFDFAIALDPMGSPAGLTQGIDWMLLAFYERNDSTDGWQTALAAARWGSTMEETTWTTSGSPATSMVPANSEPFAFPVPAGEADVGGSIYFVLAARGPAGSPFGIGVRALPQEYAGSTTSATEDWPDFLGLAKGDGRPPVVPERVATGTGLHLALYAERIASTQAGIVQRTTDMAPPDEVIPPELSDVFTGRMTSMASDVSWGGFSLVTIRYTNIPDASRWEVAGNVHGEEVNTSAFIDQTAKSCSVTAEGSQGSSLENTVMNPWTLAIELLTFQHFSVGVQIEPVTGFPLRAERSC